MISTHAVGTDGPGRRRPTKTHEGALLAASNALLRPRGNYPAVMEGADEVMETYKNRGVPSVYTYQPPR